MAIKGGKRPGAGRKAGGRNKATVLKQEVRAAAIAKMVDSGKPLAITVLQKAMEFAEGALAMYRPTMQQEIARGATQNPDGDHDNFGKWFDRWLKVTETLAEFQTPKMKAIEAPTKPPEPGANRKRFTLRVFEGGRQISGPKPDNDEEAA